MPWGRSAAVMIAAFALTPALRGQVQVGDRPEVLTPRKDSPEEQQRKEALTLFGVGVLRERSDRLIDALEALETVAKLDPEALAPRRALIPVYLAVGRDAEALAACKAVLDADPADYETAFHRFKILATTGRPKEAVEALRQGVASKRAADRPERLLVMLAELAALQEREGDFAGAEESHRGVVRVFTERRDALLATGELRVEDLEGSQAQTQERVGRCALQQKRYDAAVAAYRAARDLYAKHPDARGRAQANRLNWNLSEVCFAQERWADALVYLNDYLAQQPAGIEPYERLIVLLKRLGKGAGTVPALRKAVARDPHHVGLQLLLARELGADPKSEREAEALYRGLAERYVNPDIYGGLFKLYQGRGETARALDLLDAAFRAAHDDPDERPADEREAAAGRGRAMLAAIKADPGLAAALVTAAAAKPEGRHIRTQALAAMLAARARQLDKAEALFRSALGQAERNPLFASEIYEGLLEVLRLARKHDEAVTLCRDLLGATRRPEGVDEPLVRHRLALALSETGKHDEALAELDAGLKQAADDRKVVMRVDRARILSQAGRHAAAAADCEAMLKEFVQSTHLRAVRLVLSQVHLDAGEPAKAEGQLRILLDLDPNDALANNNLGYQLADRGSDLDEAERMIRKALELDRLQRRPAAGGDSENAAYLDSLGWVLFRKGKAAEAREHLEKAATLPDGADDPTVWDHLGEVYRKLDEPSKARQAWEAAARLYDHDRRARHDGRRQELRRKLKLLPVSADR